jgi:hypothetical protein
LIGIAFKEWAGICRAVGVGEQLLLLRKGGIHEEHGVFRPEHSQFFLYETHFHEQHGEIVKPALLEFHTFVDVVRVDYLTELETLLKLQSFHGWTAETVTQRFYYRTPGLYVLAVRAYRTTVQSRPELPEYSGCKTWVPIQPALSVDGAKPVLEDSEFAARLECIRAALES